MASSAAPETVIGTPADGDGATMVTPQRVTVTASDGQLVHGQLFVPRGHAGKRPSDLRAWRAVATDAARLALQ